ncbi:MAG: tetratricopeptide repeat protein [Muribaculaceae bacterium]
MKHLLVFLSAIGLIATAFAFDRDELNRNAQQQRANFAYISAESFADDYADNYMFMRHAYLADTANLDVASEYVLASLMGGFGSISEETFNQYVDIIHRWYLQDPGDMNHAEIATHFAQMTDDIDWQKQIWRNMIARHPAETDIYLGFSRFLLLDARTTDSTYIDTALSVLAECQQRCADPESAFPYIAACYLVKRDTIAFANQVQQIAAKQPTEVERLTLIGRSWKDFCPDTALVYYRRAVALDSTVAGDAYTALMGHYYEVDDTANFNAMARRALYSPELDDETREDYLSYYVGYNSDNEALRDSIYRILDDMTAMMPGSAKAHTTYARYLYTNNDTAASLEHFEYACALDPRNEGTQYMRMNINLELGDTVRAIEVAKECIPYFLNPSEEDDESEYGSRHRLPRSFFPLCAAQYLLSTDHPSEALALMDSLQLASIITEKSELANVEGLYGSVYFGLNEVDSAIVHAEAALNYDPSAGNLNNLAYFLSVANRDLDRANRYIREALYDEPSNPTYLDTYAWVLFRQKDYQGARIQIDKALYSFGITTSSDPAAIIDPVVPKTDTLNMDSIEMDTMNVDFDQFHYPNEQLSAEIYDHAGDIYFMNGEPQLALLFWERALGLDPNNQRIRRKVDNKTYFFDE